MARSKIPPQILRLIVLTIVIVLVYWVAKLILTPPSFGEYGHYRGAALMEIASRPRSYAGKIACGECHQEQLEELGQFGHKGLSCEVCHGASKAHADDPEVPTPAKITDQSCLRCHEVSLARPSWMKQIDPADHFEGDKCVECHLPHKPSETP